MRPGSFNKPKPTLFDYMIIGANPVLIMLMVGSLTFFLVELTYQGQFNVRLNFIFAMFVMAIVLIARISIENGKEYAALFALPLGAVTLMAFQRFVELPGPLASFSIFVNAGLMVLIWWIAHRITWDCTVIDESQEAQGHGLLQTAGLESRHVEGELSSAEPDDPELLDLSATTGQEPVEEQPKGWWARFMARQRRPHAHGVWVIYFAIAALPIFGFGQGWLETVGQRRYALLLFCVYLASGLGLLTTTSLLGLRRYLRQRRLEMPLDMTWTWIGFGAVLILAVLLACLVIPRPAAEYSVADIPWKKATSPVSVPTNDWGMMQGQQQQNAGGASSSQDDPQNSKSSSNGPRGSTSQQQNQNSQSSGNQQSTSQQNSQPQNSSNNNRPPDSGQQSSAKSADGEQSGSNNQQSGASDSANNSRNPNQQSASQNNSRADNQASGDNASNSQSNQGASRSDNNSNAQSGSSQNSNSRNASSQNSNSQGSSSQGSNNSQNNNSQSNNSQSSNSQSNNSQNASSQNSNSQSANGENTRRQDPNDRDKSSSADPQTNQNNASQNNASQNSASQSNSSAASGRSSSGASQTPRDDAKSNRESSANGKTGSTPRATSPPQTNSSSNFLRDLFSGIPSLLKWLYYLAFALLALWLAWKYRHQVLRFWQQLMDDLRRLWERLFGVKTHVLADEVSAVPRAPSHRPFSSFTNPFASGMASRYSPAQIVSYTFAALEAWAREQGTARGADCTPLEFAQQLLRAFPELGQRPRDVCDMYCRLAYGDGRLPKQALAILRALWDDMSAPRAALTPGTA